MNRIEPRLLPLNGNIVACRAVEPVLYLVYEMF
jgi:hypothetical protein